MKKVVLALGLVAFLFAGGISLETANAGTIDKVVYDDPPKAEKKSSKSCADYSKSSKCCSKSKTATAAKSECNDKEAVKTASVSTTNSKETKKASPDKK